MKKLNVLGIIIMSLFTLSCSNWLDVKPKSEVESDLLFEDEGGFKSALTGVYGRMCGENLYGRELTFDLLEELAQRYDAGQKYASLTEEARLRMYDYKNDYTEGVSSKVRLSNIWNDMYRDIVNINNLLMNLDKQGKDIITTPNYFEVMKGEALGLRAFHYFDLLRMWGPVDIKNNGTTPVVPYRTSVGYEKLAPMSADSMVIMIEKDLLEAEALLKNDACEWGNVVDYPFLAYRQYRMNKWAVKALMARFYLYVGEPEKAAQKAKAVIDSCNLNLQVSMKADHALFDETIFALDYANMEGDLEDYFGTGQIIVTSLSQKLLGQSTLDWLYERTSIGINDIRGLNGQGVVVASNSAMSRKFIIDEENTSYNDKVPLIRLSEMYYILAETLPAGEAVDYINMVRGVRGISSVNDIAEDDFNTRDEVIEALRKEYAKDFLGEGQYFYFLKRNGIKLLPLNAYENIEMLNSYYVFEIPDAEKEYGIVTEK